MENFDAERFAQAEAPETKAEHKYPKTLELLKYTQETSFEQEEK